MKISNTMNAYRTLAVFGLFATLFSCDNNSINPTSLDGRMPINIAPSLRTKASETVFETGDEVGVYVVNHPSDFISSGNYLNNKRLVLRDTNWMSDEQAYWKDQDTEADFYAYYPYYSSIGDISVVPFSVQKDQSTEHAYKSSIFLWGKRENVIPTPSPINIETKHRMSKLIIKLCPGDGLEDIELKSAEVTVCGLKTNATINIKDGSVSAIGTSEDMKPFRSSDTEYTLLVVPQVIDQHPLVKFKIGNDEQQITATINFEPNKYYECPVTISRTGGMLDFNIGEWQEGSADLDDANNTDTPQKHLTRFLSIWKWHNTGTDARDYFDDTFDPDTTELLYYYDENDRVVKCVFSEDDLEYTRRLDYSTSGEITETCLRNEWWHDPQEGTKEYYSGTEIYRVTLNDRGYVCKWEDIEEDGFEYITYSSDGRITNLGWGPMDDQFDHDQDDYEYENGFLIRANREYRFTMGESYPNLYPDKGNILWTLVPQETFYWRYIPGLWGKMGDYLPEYSVFTILYPEPIEDVINARAKYTPTGQEVIYTTPGEVTYKTEYFSDGEYRSNLKYKFDDDGYPTSIIETSVCNLLRVEYDIVVSNELEESWSPERGYKFSIENLVISSTDIEVATDINHYYFEWD